MSDHEMQGSDGDSADGNSISSGSDAMGDVEAFEFDGQRALRAIAKFICTADVPPKSVEDDHFRKLIAMSNPLFKPSFDEVEIKCMDFYEERKAETKVMLGNLDGQISLSMDILRNEEMFFDDYLCLSAHFIDENWKLNNVVLYFRSLSVSGSSDNLLREDADWGIFRSLEDWGIETKVSTLTLTNHFDYNELVEFVKTHIQEKNGLPLNGQLFRVYCCEEIISSLVQGAFAEIEDIICKLRGLISFKFMFPLWYLTNSKLKQALDMWSQGEFSSQDVIDDYDIPSPEEWKEVEGVYKIVQSIYEVSNELFETKDRTSNVYLYHLHELREILTQKSTDSDSFIKTIAEDMLKKFDKYWDDMLYPLAIAAVLDPRFKMKYVEFVCSNVKGAEGNLQVVAVLEAIHKLVDNYVIRFPEKESFMIDSAPSYSDSEEESTPAIQVKHTFLVVQGYQQFIQSSNQPAKKSDLDLYLEEPVLPWSQDFNALIWWKTAGAKYPTLSRMARDFLAIPVSLANSFQAFYTEPRPADEVLLGLKPDLMNALKCTRSWNRNN